MSAFAFARSISMSEARMMHALFEDLSPQVVTVLQRISRPQRFEAGAILCQEGEMASEAWLIVTGQVTLSVRMPGGGCASLCTVGAGAVLGELALLDDLARRSATVVALTAVQTMTIARDDLCGLFYYNHPTSLELMRRLSLRVSDRILVAHERLRALSVAQPAQHSHAVLTPGSPFEVRPFLPMLSFFRGYQADEIDALLALGRLYTAASRALLYTEGDPARSCYLVIRGALGTTLEEDGLATRLGIAGPGSCMGVMAMLVGSHHVHTCRAREDSVLLELDAAAIERLSDPSWRVTYRFYRTRMRGLMETLQQINRALSRAEQQQLLGAAPWQPGDGTC